MPFGWEHKALEGQRGPEKTQKWILGRFLISSSNLGKISGFIQLSSKKTNRLRPCQKTGLEKFPLVSTTNRSCSWKLYNQKLYSTSNQTQALPYENYILLGVPEFIGYGPLIWPGDPGVGSYLVLCGVLHIGIMVSSRSWNRYIT